MSILRITKVRYRIFGDRKKRKRKPPENSVLATGRHFLSLGGVVRQAVPLRTLTTYISSREGDALQPFAAHSHRPITHHLNHAEVIRNIMR